MGMKKLFASLAIGFSAMVAMGANPDFRGFYGTNGIIVKTNPVTGYVGIDGSAIGTNAPNTSTNAIGAPITNLLWGRTLFVDSINGVDALAIRGDAAKPWLRVESAASNAVAGDLIYVRPGTYNITTNTIKLAHGVHMRGAGGGATVITSTNSSASGAGMFVPGSESVIDDIDWVAWAGTADINSVIWGSFYGTATYWTNATFRRCRLYGQTDVFFLSGLANPCVTTFKDCFIWSQWDALVTTGTRHLSIYENCTIIADAGAMVHDRLTLFGDCSVLKTAGGATNIFRNCTVISTNSHNPTVPVLGGAYIVTDAGSGAQTSYTHFANCYVNAAGTNIDTTFVSSRFHGPGDVNVFNSNNVIVLDACNFTTLPTLTTNYAAEVNDGTLFVTNTGPARTIFLPNIGRYGVPEHDGAELVVIDGAGNADTNNILFKTMLGQLIYPAGTTETNMASSWGTHRFRVRGTNWWLLGTYP